MNIWWFIFMGLGIFSLTSGFIYLALKIGKDSRKDVTGDILDDAQKEVSRIFNDEFREELRNRGRLHFEKIINDNAMFLQQDLQLTASDLNEFMQNEIKKVLKEEFEKYEQSIEGAKQAAIQSIEKTQQLLDEQRQSLSKQLEEEVNKEKLALIKRFEDNMSQVVNHYLLEAIGNEIDVSDQINYIFRNLEENKADIVEDLKNTT